jgi:ribosomal protein S18 acetylase RimI-like enzyme
MSLIRHAIQDDAPGIARVMQASGLDDTPDIARIARVILEHCTLVAVDRNEIMGFVDSFATIGADRTIRWEIDLIGVHPAWQGRGIARQLVSAAILEGTQSNANQTRALIRADNLPSQRTFAWCDFKPEAIPFNLYVGSPHGGLIQNLPPASHLLSIATLTYTGIWIEGKVSLPSLQTACTILAHYGWEIAGVLIPADDIKAMKISKRARYQLIGEFDWWVRR